MLDQDRKKAKMLLFSSLILGVITLNFVFFVYPRDFGGSPALLIGLIAISLLVKSILSLKKPLPPQSNHPVGSSAPGLVQPVMSVNSTVVAVQPEPPLPVVRNGLGIVVGGLGAYLAIVLTFYVLMDWSVIVMAPAAAVLVAFLAFLLINKDSILQAITTALLTAWFTFMFGFGTQDDAVKYAAIAVVAIGGCAFNRLFLGWVKRRYGLVFIAVAVVLGLVYSAAASTLRFQIDRQGRQKDLQALDFQYYEPSYLPEELMLGDSYVAGFGSESYVRTNLLTASRSSIVMNQFKQHPTYNPPTNCGPEYPGRVDTWTACKEVGKSKIGCTVYRQVEIFRKQPAAKQIGFVGKEEELSSAFCSFDGVTVVINITIFDLSTEEMIKIFDSLKVAGGRKTANTAQSPSQQENPEIQRFITTHPIPIDRIKQVSKFRSCIQPYQNGANNGGQPETNRSLSHHYQLIAGAVVDFKVVAPFDSTVDDVSYRADGSVDAIRLTSATPWTLEVGLSNMLATIAMGDTLKEGEAFGFIRAGDDFELTLFKQVGEEEIYDSVFMHFSQSILDSYTKHGASESNTTIPSTERDANPCPSDKIPYQITLTPF